jgi:hypothetical protein
MTNLVQEVNPITPAQKAKMFGANTKVDWTADGLTITRLRLLSDPGHPEWDVSYCYGEIDGKAVQVRLPFSYLPKRNMKSALYAEAKLSGKFIKGLFQAVSTLN